MRRTRFIELGLMTFAATLVLSGCNSTSISVSPTTPSPSSPAAYVYVSSQTASGGPNEIVAYSADANGQLAAVPGSPFMQSVDSMAASGGYLVAASSTQADINSYTIGSNGALTLASQFALTQQTGYQASGGSVCGGVGGFVFDRTGKTLYSAVNNISCSSNNAIASYAFDSSKGG